MAAVKIVQQFTKFVIPFKYDSRTTNLLAFTYKNVKGAEVSLFSVTSQKSEGLRDGLDELLDVNGGDTKIANIYRLNEGGRRFFGLPKRSVDLITFFKRGAKGEAYTLSIPSIRVLLFESKVGFLEIECKYGSDSVQDLIDCNYFIGEIKSKENRYCFDYDEWDGEKNCKITKRFEASMTDLIKNLLDCIKVIDGGKIIYTKPLIYSYLLLDKKPEDIDVLLFHLRKNYKASYKYPVNKFSNGVNPFVMQQFENSYWSASLNGAVNLCFMTGEADTDNFFRTAYSKKLHDTYYSLFINVVHQRYALLKMIGDMGKLDSLVNDYAVMKKQLKIARNYKAEALNIKFRAFFKMPSHIEHLNDYFLLLNRTFHIDELYKNFISDLQTLDGVCDIYVSRIKERDKMIENRRKAKAEIFVAIFGTVVGLLTLVSQYWDLIERIFGGQVTIFSVQILLLFGLLLLPISTIIVDVYYRIKEIRKITSDLKNDVEDGLVEDDRLRRLRKKYKESGQIEKLMEIEKEYEKDDDAL